MVSSQYDVKVAVELLKDRAYDYVVKDGDVRNRLWNILKNLKESIEFKSEIFSLREEVQSKYEFSEAIRGTSSVMNNVFRLMEKAAKTNINVSITGETGTGKELVAKAVHYKSNRASKPFVPVNVAAVPRDLIESELFGHEKGAFTGATNQRIGKFEEAGSGTVFLDEIGELGICLQAKLLRVLQEREVVRVGGNKPIKVKARIVVATHRDLLNESKEGRFREEMYYRIIVLSIKLPPLRERE